MRDNGISAVASVRRSNQSLFELTATRISMGCADVFVNREFHRSADCNVATDVLLDESDVIRMIDDCFSQYGVACRRWIPAAAQNVGELAKALYSHDVRAIEVTTFRFERGAQAAASNSDLNALRILEARAMRRAFTELAEQHFPSDAMMQSVLLERLNSPQYTSFVALLDGRPAGGAALFQTGEVGRLCDLFVAPAYRRRGIGAALIARVSANAQRWALRELVASADAAREDAHAFLARTGFVAAGTMIEFVRPDAAARAGGE